MFQSFNLFLEFWKIPIRICPWRTYRNTYAKRLLLVWMFEDRGWTVFSKGFLQSMVWTELRCISDATQINFLGINSSSRWFLWNIFFCFWDYKKHFFLIWLWNSPWKKHNLFAAVVFQAHSSNSFLVAFLTQFLKLELILKVSF